MLIFQVSAAKKDAFSDMKEAARTLSQSAGYSAVIGEYSDAGKTYQRLLVKRESDGKFFDYRISGEDIGKEGNWVSQEKWNKLLGRNYTTKIGESVLEPAPKENAFMKPVKTEKTHDAEKQGLVKKVKITKMPPVENAPGQPSSIGFRLDFPKLPSISNMADFNEILRSAQGSGLEWVESLNGKASEDVRQGLETLYGYMGRNGGTKLSDGFEAYLNTHHDEFEKAYGLLNGEIRSEGINRKGHRSFKTQGTDEQVRLITLVSFASDYLTAGRVSYTTMLALAGQESNWSRPKSSENGYGPFQITNDSSVKYLADRDKNWIGKINALLVGWGSPMSLGDDGYVKHDENWKKDIALNGLAAMETIMMKSIDKGGKPLDLGKPSSFKELFRYYNQNLDEPGINKPFGDSVYVCKRELEKRIKTENLVDLAFGKAAPPG